MGPEPAGERTRRPLWLKRTLGTSARFFELRRMVKACGLATVCEGAGCPNVSECWSNGTLTVMILGDICTRSCRFCGVSGGRPLPLDPNEPQKVSELLAQLGLRYVVLTSVDRDDLADGGASHWAQTIRQVRAAVPDTEIEILVPDFRGDVHAQDIVLTEKVDVFAHNVETVKSLQKSVRPQAGYQRSLDLLQRSSRQGLLTKSGFMVGLGESMEQVEETFRDLEAVGVALVTVGQYLQPGRELLPVARFWSPEEFHEIRRVGQSMGLHVFAGPMVRSSYRADALAHGAGDHLDTTGVS